MIHYLTKFLKGHHNSKLPILLAFSGGPDSLALLHLLLDYGKSNPLKFGLAHVDHGWREESKAEAIEIAGMAETYGLPFHLRTLDPKLLKGNLEAACREERFRFFASLCNDHGYQAVLLAHHADDVAETVLKRTFEGASLPYLVGIKSVTMINEVKVWRPLLNISKKNIVDWLEARNLQGFVDKTNMDPKYLRAKFRLSLMPYLSEVFGKEISPGLCQISRDAEELGEYLDGKVQPYLDCTVKGKFGELLDLSEQCPGYDLELKHLIRQFCKSTRFPLNRECLAKAVEFVKGNEANKSFIVVKGNTSQSLWIDRGHLFIPKKGDDSHWQLATSGYDLQENLKPSDWNRVWRDGVGEVVLPQGNYEMASPESSLTKWWTNHKVPAFFRMDIPVLLRNGKVVHEFLTGKRLRSHDLPENEHLMKVTIKRS